MGVNLSRTSNVIFFVFILAASSYFVAKGFNALLPNLPFWIETLSPLLIYGILFGLFDKYAWHWKIFRIFGVVETPDLRGRWKGFQQSSHKEGGKNVEVPSCLEIRQTFSKIFVKACYEKSASESVVANFMKLNDEVYLFYTYDNAPNSLKSGTMQSHKGTVKLQHLTSEDKLIGTYFNSIGNSGELKFEYEGRDLFGRFTI